MLCFKNKIILQTITMNTELKKFLNNGYDSRLLYGNGGLDYHLNRGIIGTGVKEDLEAYYSKKPNKKVSQKLFSQLYDYNMFPKEIDDVKETLEEKEEEKEVIEDEKETAKKIIDDAVRINEEIFKKDKQITKEVQDTNEKIPEYFKDYIDIFMKDTSRLAGLSELARGDALDDFIQETFPIKDYPELHKEIDLYVREKYSDYMKNFDKVYKEEAYDNEEYKKLQSELKEDYKGGTDIILGQTLENHLSSRQHFFETFNPDNQGKVYNTSDNSTPYYSDELQQYATKHNDEYVIPENLKNTIEYLEKTQSKKDFYGIIDSLDIQGNYRGKNSNSIAYEMKKNLTPEELKDIDIELRDIIKETNPQAFNMLQEKDKLELLDYMLVDYLSENAAYELKTLKHSYKTYAKEGTANINPGYINLVANKITGSDGKFKPYFDKTTKKLTSIKYDTKGTKVDILKDDKPRDYIVIFALSDGYYKYNITKDPNLVIDKNGRASLSYELNGTKKDYYIPIEKLKRINKNEYEKIKGTGMLRKKKTYLI